jgi:hypothetical protein
MKFLSYNSKFFYRWLFSTNCKNIGYLYLIFGLSSFYLVSILYLSIFESLCDPDVTGFLLSAKANGIQMMQLDCSNLVLKREYCEELLKKAHFIHGCDNITPRCDLAQFIHILRLIEYISLSKGYIEVPMLS